MFRVVIDSNVYVSAVVFGGTPSAVLQLADTGAFEVVVSGAIQAEVEEALERKFGYDPGLIAGIAAELWTKAHRVNPKHRVKASRDPDDDHVLACALEPAPI